jgi:hypothetical protein
LRRSDKITPRSVFIVFACNFFAKSTIILKTTLIFVMILKMNDPGWQMQLNEDEKNSAKRLLKRLRIALIIWVFVFLLTILWFSLSESI